MRAILLFFLFFSMQIVSQDIKKHKWKDRVILVISESTNNLDFKNQIELLKNNLLALKERKLVVYQITKNDFSFNFNKNWISSSKLYQKFNEKKEHFKVIIIGLDGGIKLEDSKIISSKKICTIIDGMYIRKKELRKNN